MCAILDNDVVHQVFISDDRRKARDDNRPEAGKEFFKWIDSGKGTLVVGGKLLQELARTHSFSVWMQMHLLSGRGVMRINDQEVNNRTRMLQQANLCRSNDKHVIALAQVSGARLLYSNDGLLHDDFEDKALIDNPPGKIYTTRKHKDAPPEQDNTRFRRSHRDMLRRNPCQT